MPPKKKTVKKQVKQKQKQTTRVTVNVNSNNKRKTTSASSSKAQMPIVVSSMMPGMMPSVAPNPTPAPDVNRAAEIAQIRQEMHRELQGQKAHFESLRRVVNDTAANMTAPPIVQPEPNEYDHESVSVVSAPQQIPPQQGILNPPSSSGSSRSVGSLPKRRSPASIALSDMEKGVLPQGANATTTATRSPVKTQSVALSPVKPSMASTSTSTAMEAGEKRQRALRTPEKPAEIIELNDNTLVKPKVRPRKSLPFPTPPIFDSRARTTTPTTSSPLKLPTMQQLREQGFISSRPQLPPSPMQIVPPSPRSPLQIPLPRDRLKETKRPKGLGTSEEARARRAQEKKEKTEVAAALAAPFLGTFGVAQSLVPNGMPVALKHAYRKTKEFKSDLEKAGGKSKDINTNFRNWFKQTAANFGVDDNGNEGRPGVFKQRIEGMEKKLAGWNKLLSKPK